MPLSRADRKILQWDPFEGPPERVLFEPRSDGSHLRSEEFWNGCRWSERGVELVSDLSVNWPHAAAASETGP